MADTIRELQEIIRKFRDEHDWMQFHNHKDMATALAIEAAELQKVFLSLVLVSMAALNCLK
jgi:hypothetical protein